MTDRIFLGHTTETIDASITRPATTPTYAAGDVIGTASSHVITFTDIARTAGKGGMIMSALLIDSANQATKPSLELWLFDTAPAAQADDAAFAPSDAEMERLVAIIPLTSAYVGAATVGAGGNSAIPAAAQSQPFVCAASVKDLYGCLVVRNGYTAISGEKFTIRLTVLQDY